MQETEDWADQMSLKTMLRAARAEERELLQKLLQIQGFLALKAVREIISIYGGEPLDPFSPQTMVDLAVAGVTATKSERIVTAARALLLDRDGFVSLQDIRAAVERKGIEIGGADPNSNLSSYLSQSPEFVGKRGKGWALKSSGAEIRNPVDGRFVAS